MGFSDNVWAGCGTSFRPVGVLVIAGRRLTVGTSDLHAGVLPRDASLTTRQYGFAEDVDEDDLCRRCAALGVDRGRLSFLTRPEWAAYMADYVTRRTTFRRSYGPGTEQLWDRTCHDCGGGSSPDYGGQPSWGYVLYHDAAVRAEFDRLTA